MSCYSSIMIAAFLSVLVLIYSATACPLTRYTSPYVSGHNGLEVRIEPCFRSHMDTISSVAQGCGVQVRVTNAFRKARQTLNGTVVPPAVTSNHLVGHAIDFNLVTPSGWCNSRCLKGKQNTHAECFIRGIKGRGLSWGGDWRRSDPVHIDDRLNKRNSKRWRSLYTILQRDC